MAKFMLWIKLCSASVFGLISSLFGQLNGLFYAFLICMMVDYITGVLSAIYEKRLNSETGFLGILKKVVMLLIIVLAHSLETASGVVGIRDLTLGFYIANEGISILENAGKMNVPVARNLNKILEQLKEKE